MRARLFNLSAQVAKHAKKKRFITQEFGFYFTLVWLSLGFLSTINSVVFADEKLSEDVDQARLAYQVTLDTSFLYSDSRHNEIGHFRVSGVGSTHKEILKYNSMQEMVRAFGLGDRLPDWAMRIEVQLNPAYFMDQHFTKDTVKEALAKQIEDEMAQNPTLYRQDFSGPEFQNLLENLGTETMARSETIRQRIKERKSIAEEVSDDLSKYDAVSIFYAFGMSVLDGGRLLLTFGFGKNHLTTGDFTDQNGLTQLEQITLVPLAGSRLARTVETGIIEGTATYRYNEDLALTGHIALFHDRVTLHSSSSAQAEHIISLTPEEYDGEWKMYEMDSAMLRFVLQLQGKYAEPLGAEEIQIHQSTVIRKDHGTYINLGMIIRFNDQHALHFDGSVNFKKHASAAVTYVRRREYEATRDWTSDNPWRADAYVGASIDLEPQHSLDDFDSVEKDGNGDFRLLHEERQFSGRMGVVGSIPFGDNICGRLGGEVQIDESGKPTFYAGTRWSMKLYKIPRRKNAHPCD